jgi:hypothetical protein
MLRILPVAIASIAATTLWGQLEPVGVTVGQTVRLNVSARPPDSCAAQLGFLDSAGKPVGPSSHVSLQPGQSTTLDLTSGAVVKEGGQRVIIQPRIVPDAGTAASACQADVEVNEAKPSGGPREGIQVHGHWTIDVRNPDGTLASHSDFENSLVSTGAAALVGSLSRASVTGLWHVFLDVSVAPGPCNSTQFCVIDEPTEIDSAPDSKNLTLSAPPSGPNAGSIVLAGSVTVPGGGTFIAVETLVDVCAVGAATGCNRSDMLSIAPTGFTNKVLTTPIAVVPGQLVQVTVALSFS